MIARLAAAALLLASATAGAQKSEIDEGDRAFERGQLTRAARAYDRAIAEFPGQVPADTYGKRAAIYILGRDLAGGLRFVEQVAERQHPGAPAILEQKALILWSLGRRGTAIAVAEKVAAARPETFTAQQLIGRYYSRSKPERAVAALTAYFAHRPADLAGDDALPLLRLGFAQLAVGEPAAATRQFERVLARFRDDRIARVNATNGLCAAHAAASRHDEAIVTCSRITANRGDIDARGSVFYNLARSYLGKRRYRDARRAARRYVSLRPKQGRGHLLLGDTSLGGGHPDQALRHFLDAEKRVLSAGERAQLGIRLGVTYRRLGRLDLAVARLEQALGRDPGNPELRLELGSALLSAAAVERRAGAQRQLDRKAAQVASIGVQKAGRAQTVDLRIIAGRAAYNLGELEQAETHYRAALALSPKSRKVSVRLAQAINKRAAGAFAAGDRARAAALSARALEVSPRSPTALRNLAVLALEAGDCRGARRRLAAIARVRSHALAYRRLSARAALCAGDRTAASDHYAAAETIAARPRARDNLALAAIYTEWAPLLASEDAAVDNLEQALQFAGKQRALRDAAARNLVVALYRRGWRRLGAGEDAAAAADFERARGLGRGRGAEVRALELSLGLARLGTAPRAAADIFRALAKRGDAASYLTGSYAGLGASLFAAYASYRAGGRAELERASAEIRRLLPRASGPMAVLLRDLGAAVAIDTAAGHHRAGRHTAARRSLQSARRRRPGKAVDRVIEHDLAVLEMRRDRAKARARLSRMGARPAEALVNLGILDDQSGKPRAAYDAWVKARRAGVRSRELVRWIEAKKRMFGW